jgi:hypothetical protein
VRSTFVYQDVDGAWCAGCGRRKDVPMTKPRISAEELVPLFEERVQELLEGRTGPSVIDLVPMTLANPETRVLLERLAHREAERESERRQPERPPLKAHGNTPEDVARHFGWPIRRVYRRKDEIGFVKRGSQRQSRLEVTKESVEAFKAKAA